MMNNRKKTLMTGLALLGALTAFGFLLAGCDSDSVAPQDERPTLTQDDAGNQAACVATALASVAPQIVHFNGITKDDYSYEFTGTEGIIGTVNLEYWTGGVDGDPATFDVGDYAHLWTPEPEGLEMIESVGDLEITVFALTFDIEAEVVQVTDTATILAGSSGTFTSGENVSTFTITDLVVTESSDYPSSGSMNFSAGDFDMVISFDGSNIATIAIDGVGVWEVDLDDATLTEL